MNVKSKHISTELLLGIFILSALALMAVANRDFYNITNMMLFLNRYAYMLIAAIGMNFILLTGNIDISAGSQISVVSICIALLGSFGVGIIGLFAAAIAIGIVLGAINGLFVTKIKIPSIVATLATMQVFSGILPIFFEGSIYGLPDSFTQFSNGFKLFGVIPISFVLAVIIALFAVWFMRYTRFSKKIYAIGNDKEGAKRAGINVDKILVQVYIMGGITFAIAAVIIATASKRVTSTMGVGTEMMFIASAILGGTSASGGKGKIMGTILGTFLLSIVYSAIVYLGINTTWSDAFTGGIIIVAILLNALGQTKRAGKSTKSTTEIKEVHS